MTVDVFVTAVQTALGLGALVASYRVALGPTLTDRMIALDLILLLLASGMAAESARAGSELTMAPIIVVALIAFAGTVIVARFIEWRDVDSTDEPDGEGRTS